MKIEIETNGEVSGTRLLMNGYEVPFLEFNIGASKLKSGNGVKMQLVKKSKDRPGQDICSYYKGDFSKMDSIMKEEQNDE